MIRRVIFTLILIFGIGEPLTPQGLPEAPDRQETALDTVRMEMARGRSWHAVRHLRRAFPDGPGADGELVLLFASAEAGWSNWRGVRMVLEEALASGEVESPEMWHLLGRALESGGNLEEAESAFSRVVDRAGSEGNEESDIRLEARVRRARIRGLLGRYAQALADVEEIGQESSTLAGWVALEMAERAADDGLREETRQALSMVERQEVRWLGWDLLPRALLAAGDSIGAEAAYWSALPSLTSEMDQATAWDRVALLRLARGDSIGARGAFHQVLAASSAGGPGLQAADALLGLGFDSVGAALHGARALAGSGRHQDALDAYEVYEALLGATPSPPVLLARARSHMSLGNLRTTLGLATELGDSEDPTVAAPSLTLRAQALRRLGRGAEGLEAEDELIRRFPLRPEAVEVLYSRSEARHNRGDVEGALQGYRETIELAPSQNLAGQARMRMGQILMDGGRDEEALEVYSSYLEDFPQGRRWDESAFWAGRLLLSLGQVEEGGDVLHRLRQGYPLSYYSIRAGELMGEPYDPPIPALPDTLPFPAFLQIGMAAFDGLLSAGLDRGAIWEANDLAGRIRRVGDDERRQGGLLRLAREMNARGFTREGINLGWELRRDGRPWDRDLLAAVYPFPYLDIVMAEAEERRIDPFIMAGLIRQESAFWVEARSRADARGLTQVLPATGRELARSQGPEGFEADAHLFEAEINIHLGAAFFADMRRRFGEDLPIILSAYNAGPTRALRWRRFPEVADMPRFVEKIPFTETRGYVKNVLVNKEVYSWLYAEASGRTPTEGGGPRFFP